MVGYIKVIRLGIPTNNAYRVIPVIVTGKNRQLETKGRDFHPGLWYGLNEHLTDMQSFRRYIKRLKRAGFVSDYDTQYWINEPIV